MSAAPTLTVYADYKIPTHYLAKDRIYGFADKTGAAFHHYYDTIFERFWKRDLDIESIDVLTAMLKKAGTDGAAFATYLPGDLARVAAISRAADADGEFRVLTLILDNELFWGAQHLPDIRAMPVSRSI